MKRELLFFLERIIFKLKDMDVDSVESERQDALKSLICTLSNPQDISNFPRSLERFFTSLYYLATTECLMPYSSSSELEEHALPRVHIKLHIAAYLCTANFTGRLEYSKKETVTAFFVFS